MKKYLIIPIITLISTSGIFAIPTVAQNTTVEKALEEEISQDDNLTELNEEIEQKSDAVESLEERLHAYEQQIIDKQEQQLDLQVQMDLLDISIDETELEIEKAQTELDITQTQIEILHQEIRETQNTIDRDKGSLKELIQEMHKAEQDSPVEILFNQGTLSDFYTNLEYTHSIQENIHTNVISLQDLQDSLKTTRSDLKDKKAEASTRKTTLETEKIQLDGKVAYQEQLLEEVGEDEEKFQELLAQARADQERIEAEITQLTKTAQERINKLREDIQNKLDDKENAEDLTEEEQDFLDAFTGPVRFDWPTTYRNISCEFHCPDYPYEDVLGPHSAIDIPMPMGTPIYAAASGYVERIIFDPNSTSYGAIFITHGELLMTVYGHVSDYIVEPQQYVKRGEVIGYSGGFPGTPGAGYSTGPHLHFEVRKDGFFVDPQNYLP